MGESTVIYGNLNDQCPASSGAPVAGVPIKLTYAHLGEESKVIAKVKTDAEGYFAYNWIPRAEGTYNVAASFAGNDSYEPSAEAIIV